MHLLPNVHKIYVNDDNGPYWFWILVIKDHSEIWRYVRMLRFSFRLLHLRISNIDSRIGIRRNLSTGLQRWSRLQTKEHQMQSEFLLVGHQKNSQMHATSKVWLSDHREEVRLCSWPFNIALYKSFLKHCNMNNKAMGTIWRDLSKPPQRTQGHDPRPLWLLVGIPLVLVPELASRRTDHSLIWWMSFFLFCLYHPYMICVIIFMASPLWLAVGTRS